MEAALALVIWALVIAAATMTAATANREDSRSDGILKACGVDDGDTIYKGTMAAYNSAGYLVPLLHSTASLRFAGVAYEKADNSAGADDAVQCRLWKSGEFGFVYNGGDATDALLGQTVYAIDNQTVDEDPATVTNEYAVGEIVEVVSTTVVRVRIDGHTGEGPAGQTAQAAITTLTDSTGGTANNTLTALGGITTLTDSTGDSGTHDDTLAAVTLPTAITGDGAGNLGAANAAFEDQNGAVTGVDGAGSNAASKADVDTRLVSIGNNMQELATAQTANLAALTVLRQNSSDTGQKVIELCADMEDSRNNFADLAAKVNEVLVALRAAGIIAT